MNHITYIEPYRTQTTSQLLPFRLSMTTQLHPSGDWRQSPSFRWHIDGVDDFQGLGPTPEERHLVGAAPHLSHQRGLLGKGLKYHLDRR